TLRGVRANDVRAARLSAMEDPELADCSDGAVLAGTADRDALERLRRRREEAPRDVCVEEAFARNQPARLFVARGLPVGEIPTPVRLGELPSIPIDLGRRDAERDPRGLPRRLLLARRRPELLTLGELSAVLVEVEPAKEVSSEPIRAPLRALVMDVEP